MNIIEENLYSDFKNSGITLENRIQNRSTAYIKRAICRNRNKYLKQKTRYENLMSSFFDFIDIIKEPLAYSENLTCTILSLNERERTIIYEHVILKRTHLEIAAKLSMTLSKYKPTLNR